ncbi:MAG TPA: TRAP transporter large permease subunit [Thermodesulfobacteriota bacterium]|nr:TRAP transporter large permease subunit [Thermodesulfobacteriota bacterium]
MAQGPIEVETATENHRVSGDRLARAEATALAVTQRIAFVGVIGMVIIGILTVIDVVVLRSIFKAPIPGSNEFLVTIFAVAIAAVLPSGFAQRAVLDIDLLAKRFGKRLTAWLRAAGGAIFTATLVLIAWRTGVRTYEAHVRGMETVILQWPMWPFLWTITVFFAMCVPVQFVSFLRSVALAIDATLQSVSPADSDALQNERSTRRAKTNLGFVAGIGRPAMKISIGVVVVAAILYFGIGALNPLVKSHGTSLAIFMFLFLWAVILCLVPLAAALVICAVLGAAALAGFSPALSVLGSETVGLITNADLAVIPLFLMMSGFATAGGMSADIFRLAHALFGFLRGGLALATIGGCAGFGALTGSSVATVATIGSAALPEMKRRGYSMELSTGTIAAGGTLGQLVPPSTAIVIYALLLEQSIGRLYIAVLIPAMLTALFYMMTVSITIRLNPLSAPVRDKFSGRELVLALKGSIWVFLMFGSVIGGIYTGVFTATEAASVGAVIAFLVALFRGKLKKGALWQVVGETTRSTSMLYFLIIGGMVTSFFMGTSGLPETLTKALTRSGLPGLAVVCILVGVYILLGMIMDSFAVMIATACLVAPIIITFGYDPIWWGIIMVVLIEMGVVTPPFGLNLFAIKSIAPDVSLTTVYRGVIPFIFADVVKLALLIAFPFLILWLGSAALK